MKTQLLFLLLFMFGLSLSAEDPRPLCNTEITNFHYQEEQITTCICPGPPALVLYWDSGVEDYEYEYGKKGFQRGEGVFVEVADESLKAILPFDLEEYTSYDIYIRAKCGEEFGEWYKFAFETADIHSGIESNEGRKFNVYPNPVEDILYIDFSSISDLGNMKISVLDMNGLVCREFKYQEQYNLSTLPTGMYLLKIGDGVSVETQIIQKK